MIGRRNDAVKRIYDEFCEEVVSDSFSAGSFNHSASSASPGSSGENAGTLTLGRSIDLLSTFPHAPCSSPSPQRP